MKTYLDEILLAKRAEVADPLNLELSNFSESGHARQSRDFTAALQQERIGVIAEIKPKSPSRGTFECAKDPINLALAYQQHGAVALSVLADRKFFGGSPELVWNIAHHPKIFLPVLYKDFLVHARQIRLARSCGADAVLLIARALDRTQLRDFINQAHDLEMAALVETFSVGDIEDAITAGAQLVGINNRDLQSFEVDLGRSARLGSALPRAIVKVSESGVTSPSDVALLEKCGFQAILVGEALLNAPDPGEALEALLHRSC